MICTNCFKEESKTAKTELSVTIKGEGRILGDLDCEKCPDCGDISFTHAHSLKIDKKRIALEFGLKPLGKATKAAAGSALAQKPAKGKK
jgi:YgiT-type zinc finger domain-containing protein